MFTSAPTHDCTPTLSTRTSVRPMTSSGTSTSSDSPPVASASTNGERIAGGSRLAARGWPAVMARAAAFTVARSRSAAGAANRADGELAAIVIERHGRIAACAVVGDVLDQTTSRVDAQLRLQLRGGRRPVRLLVNTAHVGGR